LEQTEGEAMTRNEVYDPHRSQPQYQGESAFAMSDFLAVQFNLLEATFRGTLSPATRDVWSGRLAKLPMGPLSRGFRALCDEQDKMPSLAQILRFARREMQQGGAPFYPEAHDKAGVACWVDESTGEFLYKAADCEEGREFLRKFREAFGPGTKPEKLFEPRHRAALLHNSRETSDSRAAIMREPGDE
jgi:hypothetical protein